MAEIRLKNFNNDLYKMIKAHAREKGIKLMPLLERLLIEAIRKYLNSDQLDGFKDLHNYNVNYSIKISQRKDGSYIVLVTDQSIGGKRAVPTSYENIANQIRQDYEILPDELIFIERYPEKGKHHSSFYREETYDLITFYWDGREYRNPKKKHLSKKEFNKMINS